jgi:predicted lipoprotein with Yx(FWY)xxD motif
MTSRTHKKSRFGALALTAAAALAFLGGACGSDDDDEGYAKPAATTAATQPADAATPAAEPTTPAAADEATVNVGDTAIGKVLIDDKGFTLYTFKNDVADDGKSAVPAAILPNWPPLVATEAATKGAGVTGDLGTATLDDGTKVVTYKGLPLYHFINDANPGDTNGQGLAGIWFVALP